MQAALADGKTGVNGAIKGDSSRVRTAITGGSGRLLLEWPGSRRVVQCYDRKPKSSDRKKYFVGAMERGDLVSWGLIGLVQAARFWDLERGASLSTLACKAIERRKTLDGQKIRS